jgi:hypothetical protein
LSETRHKGVPALFFLSYEVQNQDQSPWTAGSQGVGSLSERDEMACEEPVLSALHLLHGEPSSLCVPQLKRNLSGYIPLGKI